MRWLATGRTGAGGMQRLVGKALLADRQQQKQQYQTPKGVQQGIMHDALQPALGSGRQRGGRARGKGGHAAHGPHSQQEEASPVVPVILKGRKCEGMDCQQ